MYSRAISRSDWGDFVAAENYLDKYWLSKTEYEKKWKATQNCIFTSAKAGLSEMVFQPGFAWFVIKGGCLFVEDEFSRLRSCALSVAEAFIVIVENSSGGKVVEPTFRFKFPVDITWSEMTSGNFVSAVLLEIPYKDYFVFGESGLWGKYTSNEHAMPVDIFGFKGIAEGIFKSVLSATEELTLEEAKLPEAYRKSHKSRLRS